jgi:cell division protein FtsQ
MQVHPKRFWRITKRLSWAFALLVVLLVLFGALRYKQNSIVGRVNIEIIENPNDLKFVVEQDVKDIIFKEFGHYIEGQPIGKVQVEAVEKALEKDGFIGQATVYIDAQNTVNIKITQRQPLVRVIDIADPHYYLDALGQRIDISPKYAARVLAITGDLGVFAPNYLEIDNSRLRKAFLLAQYISKDPFWNAQIEQIHIDYSGEATLTPKIGDHIIPFGAPDKDIEIKFKKLATFYKEAMPHEGWNEYKSISVAYKNQIVAKKR